MNPPLYLLFGITMALSVAASALGAESVDELTTKMTSSDAQTREMAMRELSRGNSQNPQKSDIIPALVDGLKDSDVKVRQAAITGLLRIAAATMRVSLPANPNAPDLTAYPSVQEALLKATADPDTVVRQAALETYALTFKFTPDLENKIIQEFNAPETDGPGHPSNKTALLESLMVSGSPSPKATAFLTQMLDDPKYGVHVADRMAADHCPLSLAALDKLATKITQDKDPTTRAAYARAIGSYGKQAQRYTPQLKAALADEKDDATKASLKAAIEKTQ